MMDPGAKAVMGRADHLCLVRRSYGGVGILAYVPAHRGMLRHKRYEGTRGRLGEASPTGSSHRLASRRRVLAGHNHMERETWLRALSVVQNGVIVTDPNLPDNPIVYANPAFEALTGYLFEEVVGRNCRFLQGEDRDQPGLDELRAAIAEGRECRTVLRNFKKDGTPFWNRLTVAPVREGDGDVVGFVGVQEDVTELREAGEHASRYAAILEATTDFVATADADGRVLFVNRAGRRMLGMGEAEDLRGTSVFDYYPGWARGVVEEAISAAVSGGVWSGETALLSHEGREIPVSQVILAHRDPEGELEYLSTIARDISDRKRAEGALREGARHLRAVLDGLSAFVGVLAPDGTILEGNRAALEAVGRSLEEVRGASFTEARWWSHSQEVKARVADALRRGVLGETSRFDAEMWLGDGRVICVDFSLTPLFGPAGEVSRLVVSATDITERRRAEEEVERRTRQQAAVARLGLRALAETDLSPLMDEAAAVLARTLSVEYCKVLELLPGGEELLLRAGTGWKAGLVGRATEGTGLDSQAGYTLRSDGPVISEDLRTETRFSPSALLREHGTVSGISTVIPGRQGPFGVLAAHTRERRTFTENDLNFLQAVANVIAAAVERRQTEEEMRDLREAERVRIARDIHDEALQDIVHALAEVELMQTAPEEAGTRRLSEALRRSVEGLRAAIFDLRLGEDQDRPFAERLEALTQLNRRYSPALEVELHVDPDLPAELGKNTETELLRILQEALANVRRHSGADKVSVAVWASEDVLWAEVSDDGRGFDGSTPPPGTGIKGMRERARALGGHLDVRSEYGGGTTVRFELPLEVKRGEPQEVRVLIVDDHASFRQAAASVLGKAPGFSVVGQAGSLSEARRLLATTRKVDVAIVDLGLPDGYGADLIGELRASNPQAQALVLSAALDRAEVARAVESGAAGVLHKSAQMSEVVDATRRLRAGETLLPLEEVVELLRFAGARKEREYEVRRAIERLTPREREVLRTLAEGLDSEEIAERLNISVKTERNHISSIFAKLGVHSRLQALVFAARYGVVDVG